MKFQQVPTKQSTTIATVLTKELYNFSAILKRNLSAFNNIEAYLDLPTGRCLL